MSSIDIRGLTKSFGDTVALEPTDVEIADGEFVVIVGASGCGKSTLLRLIAGLEQPTAGTITIDGRDVTALEPAERGIAMVFQSYALYPHLTVAENIAFPLRMARMERTAIDHKVGAVAEKLELTELLDRRPRELSGGQRQRVSIGRAIVRDCKVLLLDEPLSNLDAALRVRMRYEIARLHGELGVTMIYVTHDQLEAMTLANRIIVMAHAAVAQVGAPLDLYGAPATLSVARAIGSPAMNLIPVTIADGSSVMLSDGSTIAVGTWVSADHIGRAATLGVRPEHLRLQGDGAFGGRVQLFERLGPLSFAHLGDGNREPLVAQLPSDSHVTLGERLCFSVDPAKALLFDADGAAYPLMLPPSTPEK